ncbi:hypothetical protein ACFFIY_09010 [Bhargavaea ullalensis]
MGYIGLVVALIVIIVIAGSRNMKIREELMEEETAANRENRIPSGVQAAVIFRVSGVDGRNEAGEDIQSVLRRIGSQYNSEGELEPFDGMTDNEALGLYQKIGEFENQPLEDVIRLVYDPADPQHPNVIKVYLRDPTGQWHHVGKVGEEDNRRIEDMLNNDQIAGTWAELTGGRYKEIEFNESEDKDVLKTIEMERGLTVMLLRPD